MTDLTEVLARAIAPLDWVRLGLADTKASAMRREQAVDYAKRCLAALDAAGYQIVPKEPTPAMLDAVHFSDEALFHGADVSYAYAAMLEAAREGR